jgi:hypothetical protein
MTELFHWAVAALALAAIICLPGWGAVCLAEGGRRWIRRWHVVWLAGCAAGAPLLYITGRIVPFGGVAALVASAVAGGGMAMLSSVVRRRRRMGAAHRPAAWSVALVSLIALTIAMAFIELPTGGDIYPTAVRDLNPRQAMIWSIRHYGLPLQDSLFYPGRPLPMYYSLGAYPAIAAAGELGGPGVPDSWPYAIFAAVTFLATCLLAADIAGRMFASRKAASWAAVLVSVGGMDVLVNAALKLTGHPVSLGHVGAWADAHLLRIDGLYVCGLWATPHLASLAAVMVLVRWVPLDIRRRPAGVLASGMVLSGAFFLSPYVTIAAVAVMAASLAVRAARRRWRHLARHSLAVAACGLVAAVLAAPYVLDLKAADLSGGRAKLVAALPEPSIHPVSAFIPGPAGTVLDMTVQLLAELMPLLALGLLGWRACRATIRWRLQKSLLAIAVPVSLLLVLLLRSTGRVNDWGVRVAHVCQFACVVLGAGLMARSFQWGLARRAAAYAFILIGLSAAGWNMASANLGRFLVETPRNRQALYQASRFVARNTPRDEVVMFDLKMDGIDYARRWSDRRALLASEIHGSLAYTNQALLAEVRRACLEVDREGLGPEQVGQMRRFGAGVAVVPKGLVRPGMRDRLLYENSEFAVVELK